jgi:hypothetical protein
MKKLFLLSSVTVFIGIISLALYTSQTYAKPNCQSVANNLNICTNNLNLCTADLGTCDGDLSTCDASLTTCTDDLAACEAEPDLVFPGDGNDNPDAFGVSGHGPTLSYTDNGDGTFTDNNTGLNWEEKDDADGIHDKDNPYTWTDIGGADDTNPDGTLFTVFLNGLNNTCDGAGVDACATDADCATIGNEVCGFAGHQDWRIPNIKELNGIVDYSTFSPATSVPGLTVSSDYWSSTSFADFHNFAMVQGYSSGNVGRITKSTGIHGRAVRP